jgi:alpha-methylacyl-CoA racemase
MRPLEGLLVLDFSTLLPGPYATLMLAEAGARVVKVERPGGEDSRRFEPAWGDTSAIHALLNRGKEVIFADLKSPDDIARLRPLLSSCDVLVEQFRPGVMARLGMGEPEVRKLNPGVIYCSISGYGQTGPYAQKPDHDLGYQASTGLLALGGPHVPAALSADIAGGSYPAMINILLALQRRARTGEGAMLDIAMADGCFPFTLFAQAEMQAGSGVPEPGCGMLNGGLARYRIYTASDGVGIAVAALEPKFWAEVVSVTGLEPDPDEGVTAGRLQTILGSRPSRYWKAAFAGRDACVSIVASLSEARSDPHFIGRGLRAHSIDNTNGQWMDAAPVPISSIFRGVPGEPGKAP